MPNERILFLRKAMKDYCAPLTEEINTYIIEQWNDGHSISDIAEDTDYSERTIQNKLIELGIEWKSREPDFKPKIKHEAEPELEPELPVIDQILAKGINYGF